MKLILPSVVLLGVLATPQTVPPRFYELTTETVMPHLEESLRYATTREKSCLSPEGLVSAFPILKHPALEGCRLQEENRAKALVSYFLACENGTGTTGKATWQKDGLQLKGMLDVKLGGKNMTFYQRITARDLGACTQEEFESKTRSAAGLDGH
jgi:hypothetical protein